MKKHPVLWVFVLFALILTGKAGGTEPAEPEGPRVRLETNKGDIILALDPGKAPRTVENFLQHVQSGFYDGTIFHRVMKGFMIQAGGFTEDMTKKPTGDPIVNEADNGLKNRRGTVAMARTNSPHSATAQFFINTVNNSFLNHRGKSPRGWGYCVYGKVIKGIEVVHDIEKASVTSRMGHQNVPVSPIVIKRAVRVK